MFKRASTSFRTISFSLLFLFASTIFFAEFLKVKHSYAQAAIQPLPQGVLSSSQAYSMPLLKGLKFDPKDPLSLEFIVDNANLNKFSETEFNNLVSYFLVGLTVNASDLWVNLSPYEKNRILPQAISSTELGKDILAQDYILKQLSASLTYPDTDLGKAYWDKQSDTSFNKIWIVPEEAEVYEKDGLAIIKKSKLKVLSETDYLATAEASNKSVAVREENQQVNVLLPEISKEVNQGKHFAKLRQVYSALILSTWFKQKVRDSFYANYIDQDKVDGQELAEKNFKEQTYAKYLDSVKNGVYDLIKKESLGEQKIKKQYFCGGNSYRTLPDVFKQSSSIKPEDKETIGPVSAAKIKLEVINNDLHILDKDGTMIYDESRIEWPEWYADFNIYELKRYLSKTAHAIRLTFKSFKMDDEMLEGNLQLDLGDYIASEVREKFHAYLYWLEMFRDRASTYSDVVEFKRAKEVMLEAYRELKLSAKRRTFYKNVDKSIQDQINSKTPLSRKDAFIYLQHKAFWKDKNAKENFKQYKKIVSELSLAKERLDELEKEFFVKVKQEIQLTDESEYHPYPQWLKLDKDGHTTAASIMPVYLPREVYADSGNWENNIDFKAVIDRAKRMGFTAIMLLPVGARSQYDDRKSKSGSVEYELVISEENGVTKIEMLPRTGSQQSGKTYDNAKTYALAVDEYIRRKELGEDVTFDFVIDDSPYSMLSFHSFDRRNIVLREIEISGASLEEKFEHYKLGEDYLDIFTTMNESEEVREFADTMAIRALKDARPEYLDYILRNYPEYKAVDFVELSYSKIRSHDIYFKLKSLVLFEQYWAQKQFAENVKYAHAQGVKVMLDVPAFPSVNGVEAISNPKMINTDENGEVISPGVGDQRWTSLSDLDRNGYLKRKKFKPLINIFDWWKTKFGIDGFRGDAWHFSKGAEGNWEAVTEYMRENNLLFLVETAGAFDAPQINPYSRTLGGINLEVGWENEGQGRIDTLENMVYGEHGLKENSYVTTMMLPAVHDFLSIPEKFRNVFGGTQDNEVITRGVLGLYAMASNTWSLAPGNEFASDRAINARPGHDGLWEGGREDTGIDLIDYIGRLNQIRKDNPYLLNPNNLAISIIAPGVVQVERYSRKGKKAIISIHNISAETKEGFFSVAHDHFKLDPNKAFTLKDLMLDDVEYEFSKAKGTVNENNGFYYKLKPGQTHVFKFGQGADHRESQSSSIGVGPNSLANDRGFGKMELSKKREDFAIALAQELTNQDIDYSRALILAETIASLKLGSIRLRAEFFAGLDSFVFLGRVDENEIKKNIRVFLKRYEQEFTSYTTATDVKGDKLFSVDEVNLLLDENLIPFSWYQKLIKEGFDHVQAIEELSEIPNPVNQWKITLKFSLAKPKSVGIERHNSIDLVLLYKKDFLKQWKAIESFLDHIKDMYSEAQEITNDAAATRFIEWIDKIAKGDKSLKHQIAMDIVDYYRSRDMILDDQQQAFSETLKEFKISDFKLALNSSSIFTIPAIAMEKTDEISFKKVEVTGTDIFFHEIYLSKEDIEKGKSIGRINFRAQGDDRFIDSLDFGENFNESVALSIIHKMLSGAYAQGKFEFKLYHQDLEKYYDLLSKFEVIRKAKVEYGEYGEDFRGSNSGYHAIGTYLSLEEAKGNIQKNHYITIKVPKVYKYESVLDVAGNRELWDAIKGQFDKEDKRKASSSLVKRDPEQKLIALTVINNDERATHFVELEKQHAIQDQDASFSIIEKDLFVRNKAQRYLSDAISVNQYIASILRAFDRNELRIDPKMAVSEYPVSLGTIKIGDHWNSSDPEANTQELLLAFKKSLNRTVYTYLEDKGYDLKGRQRIKKKVDEVFELLMRHEALQRYTIHQVDEIILTALRGIVDFDPYEEIKTEARELALSFVQDLLEQENRGLIKIDINTAFKLSAVGNSLDFANPEMAEKFKNGELGIDYLQNQLNDLTYTKDDSDILAAYLDNPNANILYALDNAGEDVFDLLLLRELLKRGANLTIVTKSLPAVNDTTYDDAIKLLADTRVSNIFDGLDMKNLDVIPSGSITYGLDLARTSPQLMAAWRDADMLIAKGQANYYTLKKMQINLPVFFLGKCKVAVEMFDEYKKGDYFLEYSFAPHESLYNTFAGAYEMLYSARQYYEEAGRIYEGLESRHEENEAYAEAEGNVKMLEAVEKERDALEISNKVLDVLVREINGLQHKDDYLSKLFFYSLDNGTYGVGNKTLDTTYELKLKLTPFKALLEMVHFGDIEYKQKMHEKAMNAFENGMKVLPELLDLLEFIEGRSEQWVYENLPILYKKDVISQEKNASIDMPAAMELLEASFEDVSKTSVQGGMDFKDIKVSSSGIIVPLELENISFEDFAGFDFTFVSSANYKNLNGYINNL